MKRLALVTFSVVALTLLLSGASFAETPSTGFATYKVSASTPMGSHSVLVNETVKSTAKSGFSDLILQLTGSSNLTYSRLVNASSMLFPFFPGVPSQQLDYSNGTYSVNASISAGGTASITFQGSQYTLDVYSFSVVGTYGNRTMVAVGTIETFPSTLVYSAKVQSGIVFEAQATLQSTDLQLDATQPQMATATYVGAGIGVAGLAGAAALFVRRRDRKAKTQQQKPMHWVD